MRLQSVACPAVNTLHSSCGLTVACLHTGRILLKGDNITLMQTTCVQSPLAMHVLAFPCTMEDIVVSSEHARLCAEGGRSGPCNPREERRTERRGCRMGAMPVCALGSKAALLEFLAGRQASQRDSKLLTLHAASHQV